MRRGRKFAAKLTRRKFQPNGTPFPSHTPSYQTISPIPFPAGVRLTGLYITRQSGMRAGLYYLLQVTSNGTYWKITNLRPDDDRMDNGVPPSSLPRAARLLRYVDSVKDCEYASSVLLQDDTPFRALEELLSQYGALAWDGYDETDPRPGVLDSGDQYELYLALSDGSTVSMKGYNVCPAGFMPLLAKIQELFDRHSDYSRYMAKRLDDAPCQSVFVMFRDGMYSEYRLELRSSDDRWVVVLRDPYGSYLPTGTDIADYGSLPGQLPFDRVIALLQRHNAERWSSYHKSSAASNSGFTLLLTFADGKKFEMSGNEYPEGFADCKQELILAMHRFQTERKEADM